MTEKVHKLFKQPPPKKDAAKELVKSMEKSGVFVPFPLHLAAREEENNE